MSTTLSPELGTIIESSQTVVYMRGGKPVEVEVAQTLKTIEPSRTINGVTYVACEIIASDLPNLHGRKRLEVISR